MTLLSNFRAAICMYDNHEEESSSVGNTCDKLIECNKHVYINIIG